MATRNDDLEILTKCRDACDKRLMQPAAEGKLALSHSTAQLLRDATTALEALTAPKAGFWRRFHIQRQRLAWLTVYAATILGLLAWYEVRPIVRAHWALQGGWQFVNGYPPNEQRADTYMHVSGFDSWFCSLNGTAWNAHKSRLSLRPARDFYIVRRKYDFGRPQNQYEREDIIRLVDNRLYTLRGIAQLDSVKTRTIEKLERVDELPPELLQKLKTVP